MQGSRPGRRRASHTVADAHTAAERSRGAAAVSVAAGPCACESETGATAGQSASCRRLLGRPSDTAAGTRKRAMPLAAVLGVAVAVVSPAPSAVAFKTNSAAPGLHPIVPCCCLNSGWSRTTGTQRAQLYTLATAACLGMWLLISHVHTRGGVTPTRTLGSHSSKAVWHTSSAHMAAGGTPGHWTRSCATALPDPDALLGVL